MIIRHWTSRPIAWSSATSQSSWKEEYGNYTRSVLGGRWIDGLAHLGQSLCFGYYEEFLDGRNEFVGQAFDVWSQVVFDVLRSRRTIFQIEFQLIRPDLHKPGDEFPEVPLIVLEW